MTRFPSIDDLVLAATRALGHQPEVRDWGLLQGALARAQATVFGKDAYPTVHDKAAALLHSLVRNHALVDGNERLGWVGTFGFYWINGVLLTAPTVDDGEKFVVAIASGELDVPEIAGTLRAWTTPRLSQ